MSITVLANGVDPVKLLSMMSTMMQNARLNLSNSGEVKLVANLMEMEIKAGEKTVLSAAYDTANNCWSVNGDARLGPAVQKLIR